MWAILWKYFSEYKSKWVFLMNFFGLPIFLFFFKNNSWKYHVWDLEILKWISRSEEKSHMTWQFNFSWVSTFCAPQFAIIIVVKVRYGYKTTFFAELFLKGSSSRESKMFRKKMKMIVYLPIYQTFWIE